MAPMSVSAHDVAAYILKHHGPVSAMKLQKLLYYSQAWSLVWDEEPLFSEEIEAWANGPVVRDIYDVHRGQFIVSDWPKGDEQAVRGEQAETVDAVLSNYGKKPAQWLSDLTHMERPWIEARKGLSDGERGFSIITHASLAEYYGSLSPDA
jgi:uncharacterized phage-associated protein